MNIEYERELSEKMISGLQERFSNQGEDFLPIRIMISWDRLLHVEPVDYFALKNLVDEALPRKNDFDIVYFTFCTHVEEVVKKEIRDSFKLLRTFLSSYNWPNCYRKNSRNWAGTVVKNDANGSLRREGARI